ncbi:hypothetical protein BIV57_18020 [Mangrovactinospora gilvigrisea]|uniref:Uncharacterized protein n=1 Tax=Mangrovactinospora gilvigrisea TaxID=1428644 RepID=A0A1J7BBS2_9ACTN|nr:hypothetical protein [Mangrovactinospora gilvigrisea]OIV36135.1 hypothetical protein BIV57_18020 [Mangrovactinospora gilvigrisea]
MNLADIRRALTGAGYTVTDWTTARTDLTKHYTSTEYAQSFAPNGLKITRADKSANGYVIARTIPASHTKPARNAFYILVSLDVRDDVPASLDAADVVRAFDAVIDIEVSWQNKRL